MPEPDLFVANAAHHCLQVLAEVQADADHHDIPRQLLMVQRLAHAAADDADAAACQHANDPGLGWIPVTAAFALVAPLVAALHFLEAVAGNLCMTQHKC